MTNPIIAETIEHAAFLTLPVEDDVAGSVAVFRKAPGGTMVPMGTGRWENGTVLGSGVNCGVLVHLERQLREKTGTP